MSTRTDKLKPHHDRIVALRSEGRDWRSIAVELARLGVETDHNALVRYARSAGLPTGRIEKPVASGSPTPAGALADLGFTSAPPPAPPPQPVLPISPQVIPIVLRVEVQHVAAPTPVQQESPAPKPTPSPSTPDAAPLTLEQQALGDLVAGIMPAILRIERAQKSDDPDELQRALKVAVAWLQSAGQHAPEDIRQRVEEAINGLQRFMTPSPPAPSAAGLYSTEPSADQALFTPLARGPWWTPDLPLVNFSERDTWTLQDACEGTLILGATGSGKTSGSGAMLAKSFLSSGFGGLVLTVKPDERELWERYARQCGRSEQLCVVRPGASFRLNFLDYEARRSTSGGGLIENLVTLFYTVLEAQSRGQGEGQARAFWENASKQLLRNTFRVLTLARSRLSLDDLGRFIAESPHGPVTKDMAWKNTPQFGQWLEAATAKAAGTPDERVIREARRFWLEEFATLAPETRSCLITGLSAMVDAFVEPAIHELFCTSTTLTPEAAMDGAIILVDLPLKQYRSVGLFAQAIWKHLFQQAVERRDDPSDASRRPVFLWADEAQFFYSPHDTLFQSTARSARCATVYLTQNLPGFYARGHSHDEVTGFVGNLVTKVIHNNNDPATNQWAAEQIGRSMQYRASVSQAEQPSALQRIFGRGGLMEWFSPSPRGSTSVTPQMDFEVQPSEFTKLRTGSPRHGGLVDAFVIKAGHRFSTGQHYLKTVFKQE